MNENMKTNYYVRDGVGDRGIPASLQGGTIKPERRISNRT